MSLSQPSPPDPYLLASQQGGLNLQAAQQAAGLSEANQNTPFGSLVIQGAGGPNPTYNQTLSPAQQALLDRYQATQGTLGTTAGNLAGAVSGMYGAIPDFTSMSSPLIKAQMKAFNDYMAPTYKMQQSNLDAKLQNQGLAQGSEAWTNAQRGQKQSQDQAAQSALMNFEPQAYSQAVSSYELPMQTLASLFGATAPQGVQQPFVPTYSTQNPQPANLMGAAEQNYAQQNQIFGNTMQGLSSLGSAAVKGLFGLAA